MRSAPFKTTSTLINTSPVSEDGEEIHPSKNFDQSYIYPPTCVDCFSDSYNDFDKLSFYGECHGYQHYSVTDSVQQSNHENLNTYMLIIR